MRVTAVLLLALMLAIPASAQTELTFWTISDTRAEYMASRASEWNELYPDRAISLNAEVFYADMVDEKLWTVLHSGVLVPGLESPDIADVEYQDFPKYTGPLNCLLYPLDSVILQDSEAVRAFRFRGMCFGLPVGAGDMAAVYNLAELEKAGIDPGAIKDWNDFRKAGRDYLNATGKALLSVDMEHHLAFLTLYLQYARRDGAQNAHAQALEALGSMFKEGIAMIMPGGRADSKAFNEALADGTAACAFVRRADFAYLGDGSRFFVGQIPYLDGEAGVWIPGWATCVTTSCTEYALAMEFLGFAQPVPEAPAAGVISPGNADEVSQSLDRYEMQLAHLALGD